MADGRSDKGILDEGEKCFRCDIMIKIMPASAGRAPSYKLYKSWICQELEFHELTTRHDGSRDYVITAEGSSRTICSGEIQI